jgi:hypothetical protein
MVRPPVGGYGTLPEEPKVGQGASAEICVQIQCSPQKWGRISVQGCEKGVQPVDTEDESAEFAQLVAELTGLRKGLGIGTGKIKSRPLLRSLLVGTGSLEALFQAAIEGLGDGVQAHALRNAYAIGMRNPRNLTERREDFANFVGRHSDTIEAYENEMMRELAHRLLENTEISDDSLRPISETFLNDVLEWVQENVQVITYSKSIHDYESGAEAESRKLATALLQSKAGPNLVPLSDVQRHAFELFTEVKNKEAEEREAYAFAAGIVHSLNVISHVLISGQFDLEIATSVAELHLVQDQQTTSLGSDGEDDDDGAPVNE